eukprot:3439785-Prorocentrum_lima.AAC.1
MDFWDIWLDSSGPNRACRILMSRENMQEKEGGPWDEPSTVSGARFQIKQSVSQGLSRTRRFFCRQLNGMLSMEGSPRRSRGS